MLCPGCDAPMTPLTVAGHLGTTVDIDLCATCQVIWFDQRESLRLSPGATLHVFSLIARHKQAAPPPLREPLKCPRCDLRLLLTNDRQRNTPFRYRRCARDHGRLITFFDFLREKDFVRPLTPQQLAELRANVQTINCSNCGAPIDLVHASACEHCHTPLSMIDLPHVESMVANLQHAEASSHEIDPLLPERLRHEKAAVDALFAALHAEGSGNTAAQSGLVETGLRLITRLFR
jgi:hypothetical protein